MSVQQHIDTLPKWDGVKKLWVMSPKGTNGAGKSSIAHEYIRRSGRVIPIIWPEKFPASRNGEKVIATYLPDMDLVILGSYKSQCGGCDIMKLVEIQTVLWKLWSTNLNVFYEGAMVAHTKETYPLYHLKLQGLRGFPRRLSLFPFLYVHPFESVRRALGRGSARSKDGVLISKVLEKFNGTVAWKEWYDKLENTVSVWIDTHRGFEYVWNKIHLILKEKME